MTNDGVRIFDFSAATTDTPDYSGFGVSTSIQTVFILKHLIQEFLERKKTVRLGVIKHDTTNYASGYLPLLQIEVVTQELNTLHLLSNGDRLLTLNLVSPVLGISGGVFIAAPGTLLIPHLDLMVG